MPVILRRAAVATAALLAVAAVWAEGASTFYSSDPNLGSARVVFQTNYGDIEFGFFPHVAPKTVDHIFKLVRLGCYNTNHIFRVDKGFVAQVAAVMGGRTAPMNEEQQRVAEKTIVGEFSSVKHVRGILSMGRHSDPDSGGSSFSFLLGDAPHLDGQYAVFGRVTKGDDTLGKLEKLPTRREGMFVMPIERIDILSTYYYGKAGPLLRDILKTLIWRTVKQKNLFLGGDFLNQHQKLSDGEENALLDAGVISGLIWSPEMLKVEAEYGQRGK